MRVVQSSVLRLNDVIIRIYDVLTPDDHDEEMNVYRSVDFIFTPSAE